jgi:hypothetical protein
MDTNSESGGRPPHSKALRATSVIIMRHRVRHGACGAVPPLDRSAYLITMKDV